MVQASKPTPPSTPSSTPPFQTPSKHAKSEQSSISWKSILLEALVAVAGLTVCVRAILTYGVIQFGGMDGGVLSNAAWMGHLGYKPYVDFQSMCPPIYFITSRLAFDLFGVQWKSFVSFMALFSGITFTCHWFLLRRIPMGLKWKLLAAVATQAVTVVPIGWGHYNQTTAVLAALFLTAAMGLALHGEAWRDWIYLTLAAALLAAAKPNVAGPLLLLAYPVLILRAGQLWKGIACLVVAALLNLGLLACFRMNPLDVLRGYLGAGNRVLSWTNIKHFLFLDDRVEVVQTTAALAPLLAGFIIVLVNAARNRKWLSGHWRLAFLAISGLLTSLLGMATNSEHNMVDLPPFIVGSVVLLAAAHRAIRRGAQRRLAHVSVLIGCGALIFHGFSYAVDRSRIKSIGTYTFWEPDAAQPIADNSYFSDVIAGPRLFIVVNQMSAVLKKYDYVNRADAPVFFGPRMDFGYAAFGIHTRKRLPLWWPGLGEVSPRVEAELVSRFVDADFKLCIFLRRDYTWMPQPLVAHLYANFDVFETELLTIHVAKAPRIGG
jgi:hypothetical protein